MTRLAPPIFDKCPQKILDQLLISVIMYQHAKNQFILSVHSSETVNLGVLSPDWPHILTIFTSKIFNHLLICVKLYQHAKNQLLSSVLSSDTISFRVQSADWSHPFLTMPKQKFSD